MRWASWRRFSRGAAARASTKRSSVRSSCRQPYSPRRRNPRTRPVHHQRRGRAGPDSEDLEAAIDAEIETIKEAPVADWEIEKARTQRALGARRQPRKLAVACDVTVPVRTVLRQAGQDQHTRRRHRESHRRGRSARRAALSGAGRPNRRADDAEGRQVMVARLTSIACVALAGHSPVSAQQGAGSVHRRARPQRQGANFHRHPQRKLPRPQKAICRTAFMMVLEDRRVPRITFDHHPGGRRLLRPRRQSRPGRLHRQHDARGHREAVVGAAVAGAGDHCRRPQPVGRFLDPECLGVGLRADRALRSRLSNRRRCAAQPVVSCG